MIERIILLVVSVLGIGIAFKFNGIFHKIISIVILISSILYVSTKKELMMVGLILQIISAILILIYGIKIDGNKSGVILMSLYLIIAFIVKLQHIPIQGLIRIIGLVPAFYCIYFIFNQKKLTKEMSFMLFWICFIIVMFLRIFY